MTTKLVQNARNASSAYNSKRSKPSRFDHLLWNAINKNTEKRNNLVDISQTGNTVHVRPNAGNAVSIGSRKFQQFSVSLANIDVSPAYSDNDCLVELGKLDVTGVNGLEAATQIFIHKVVVMTKVKAGTTLVGNLALSGVSGTATNAALTAPAEICGAGVTAFDPIGSIAVIAAATNASGVNADIEDINLNQNAGLYHVFTPNVVAGIGLTNLYLRTTTALSNAGANVGRYSVEIEYSIL